MPYITFVTLLLLAVGGILSLHRQLLMLQQNSYSLSSYLKWLKDSYTAELAISAVLYCATTVGIIKEKLTLALILASVLTIVRVVLNIGAHKKSTKKLLFTVQVKGLYIAAILILGVLIMISAISTNMVAVVLCRMLCLMLSIVTPVLTVIVWGIIRPIEMIIRRLKSR